MNKITNLTSISSEIGKLVENSEMNVFSVQLLYLLTASRYIFPGKTTGTTGSLPPTEIGFGE